MKSKYVFAFCNSFLKIVSNVGARKNAPGKNAPGKSAPRKFAPRKIAPLPPLKEKVFYEASSCYAIS